MRCSIIYNFVVERHGDLENQVEFNITIEAHAFLRYEQNRKLRINCSSSYHILELNLNSFMPIQLNVNPIVLSSFYQHNYVDLFLSSYA